MLRIGGIGGGGVGQLLTAVAAALLLRLFSAPGPELLPEALPEDEDEEEKGDVPVKGKVAPVTIKWTNINCSLSDKSSKSVSPFLLKNVSGEAKSGRLLAIMGPSGSGKTTLLNILAGLPLLGRRISFFTVDCSRNSLFAAELQLQDISSVEERDEYVNDLLFKLGLVSCADSRVGDAKVRGISGGEKKRLSLACELIASPSVIFADEPTTGLDAFQAEKVMETLRQLAQDGHTVICSIHQPRGSVYAKFDDIVLLTEGSLVYAGPARDESLAYFSKFGYICPDHENPAEFLADLISVDYSSTESVNASQKRIDSLIESFAEQMSSTLYATPLTRLDPKDNTNLRKKIIAKNKVGWWRQFRLLLKRAWMQAFRDGPTNKIRARMSMASALIFGSVFWRMGRSQTSIQDRLGLLQVAAINTAMAALTKTVGVFPKERAIVDRESQRVLFVIKNFTRLKVFPSRFGKFCGIVTTESFAASAMGLTVGAMVPTTEAALALGPACMTVFIVFGGYYVNAENTPIVFRWIPRVSLIKWAFQGLCINEFSGLKFDHQNSFDIQSGEQALERLSFGGSRIRDTVIAQSRILLFWYYTTYLLLEKNKPKYQQLEPPPLDQIQTPLQLEPLESEPEEPNEPPESPLSDQGHFAVHVLYVLFQ
ncbi:hypothetical protein DH2020_043949 [Rehmannia glutinosa]|uniref:ABC transporter domain-containing protein n=1 Tax=Rehmannia glutinosa TaxID=99300 RepID=A0ABR0UIB3_REHGL